MDDPWRTFQRSEEKFFHECDTGHIPVIVVFTKFEALRPIAFGDVKKEVKGLPGEERSRKIAQRVEEIFTNTGVLDRLCDPKNRACPKSHLRLDNMDKPNTNCNILLEHTALALDNAELQFCLISTQQSNLELCIKCAVATFQRSEEKFFHECDTGHIPIIVVFTKFEALRPIAFGDIKKEVKGLPGEECSRKIAQRVEEIFTNTGVLDRLCDPQNQARPKSHLRLDSMDKRSTNCNILLEHTALALDNAELQFCLISTQQSNLELCIKCAVATLVDRAHSPFHYELDQLDIAKWFPQLRVR
ncbi:hypothetical protein BDR04DRAFT_1159411 [Suillus decipiens]|nr:hypothetical protein BDR04DRAFT_1159411 [Suillus decipiens]